MVALLNPFWFSGLPELFETRPPSTALFSDSFAGVGVTSSHTASSDVYSIKRTDAGASGVQGAFRGKNVPAGGSWTATMGIWTPRFNLGAANFQTGLALLDSATEEMLCVVHDNDVVTNADPRFSVMYDSDLLTASSEPFNSAYIFNATMPCFFRIVYDGTNYEFSYSLDFMQTWEVAATLAKASYFTADKIGVIARSEDAVSVADGCVVSVFYYKDPDF